MHYPLHLHPNGLYDILAPTLIFVYKYWGCDDASLATSHTIYIYIYTVLTLYHSISLILLYYSCCNSNCTYSAYRNSRR